MAKPKADDSKKVKAVELRSVVLDPGSNLTKALIALEPSFHPTIDAARGILADAAAKINYVLGVHYPAYGEAASQQQRAIALLEAAVAVRHVIDKATEVQSSLVPLNSAAFKALANGEKVNFLCDGMRIYNGSLEYKTKPAPEAMTQKLNKAQADLNLEMMKVPAIIEAGARLTAAKKEIEKWVAENKELDTDSKRVAYNLTESE